MTVTAQRANAKRPGCDPGVLRQLFHRSATGYFFCFANSLSITC